MRRNPDRDGSGLVASPGADIASVLDVLREMVVVADRSGSIRYVNSALTDTLGWAPVDLVGEPITALVPHRLRAAHRAGFEAYVDHGRRHIINGPPVIVHARCKDETEIEVELTLAEHDSDSQRNVVAVLRDLTARRQLEQAESINRYLESTSRITAQVALAIDSGSVDSVSPTVLELVVETLGWDAAALWEVDHLGTTRAISSWPTPDVSPAMADMAHPSHRFAQGRGLPGRVVASMTPAWIEDVNADPDYPRHVMATKWHLTTAFAFPILTADRTLAVVELFSHERRDVDVELVGVAGQIGRTIGQVLEQRSSQIELHSSRARKAAILDSAFDAVVSIDAAGLVTEWNRAAEATFGWPKSEVLGRPMADLIVPHSLRRQHFDGLERYLVTDEEHVLGRPIELPARRRDGTEFPAEIAITRLAGLQPPEFTGYIRDISARKQAEAAVAASQERVRHIAATLQASLIPALPEVAGVQLDGRYLPGSAQLEVGGDWYDAVPLPDGRIALVIGDVVGKGVAAAAQMGELRNAVRAYLLEGYSPSEVIVKLNRLARWLTVTGFATVLCLIYDPASGQATWCRAGHLPPLLRRADGPVDHLDEAGSPPVAVFDDAVFTEATTVLCPGDLLVLYTDGLVERRDEDIDVGIARLAAQVALIDSMDGAIDHIVAPLLDADRRDDVAIVVLRVPRQTARHGGR